MPDAREALPPGWLYWSPVAVVINDPKRPTHFHEWTKMTEVRSVTALGPAV